MVCSWHKDKDNKEINCNLEKIKSNYLIELKVNPKDWKTLYKCEQCGMFFEEKYTGGRWDGFPVLVEVSEEYVKNNWGKQYVK